MKTVLIFGGSGFVGKHIIRRIAQNGYKIIVPHQKQVNEANLRLLGKTGQIIPFKFKSLKDTKIQNIINQSDIIINLKTLWDEKIISYKKGILDFNITLIEKIKNNKRKINFIYFSGLGVDQNIDSNRSKAIFESEKYIQTNLKNSVIVRPGIVIGGGDQFLRGLLPLINMSFFIPLFGKGLSKFQPVFVDDVSIAINKIVKLSLNGNYLYEFVGLDIFSYKDFYTFLAKCMTKTRVLVPVPFKLIKIGVAIAEKTPFSPLNSEQLRLFEGDNIASNKYSLFRDLDIDPQDLKEIVKKIIRKNY